MRMPLSTWILKSTFPTDSLTFFCSLYLPMYMIHQFEEHYDDRFKIFTNTIVMNSPNPEYLLESLNILLINVGYVWALFSIVIFHSDYHCHIRPLCDCSVAHSFSYEWSWSRHFLSPTQSVESRIVDFHFLLLGTLPLHPSNYVQS